MKSERNNGETGILTKTREVVKVTFGSLFFPALNLGRVAERTFSVFDGLTDKGTERWKPGDKGLIALFREIVANGFDPEKGTFGIRPLEAGETETERFVPGKDRTPVGLGLQDEAIAPLTISDETYADIVHDVHGVTPTYAVTGGYHRAQILYSLIALGILTVEQVANMTVRCVQADALTDNIRDATIKANAIETLRSAFFLLDKSNKKTEKVLYAPGDGKNALCPSKGGAGVYWLLYLVCRKVTGQKTIDDLVSVLTKSGRVPSQNLRKEILAIVDCEGKSVAKELTTEKADKVWQFLQTKPDKREEPDLNVYDDNSVRQGLIDAFRGKKWGTVNRFFKDFATEIERLKFDFRAQMEDDK